MSTHTKGPWHYDIYEHALYIWGPDMEMIADNSGTKMEVCLLRIRGVGADLPMEANARLIAAAPDMLDALKESGEALQYWHNSLSTPITDAECAAVTELERLIANTRAAIQKAEAAS